VDDDYRGVPRPKGAGFDIGAIEYSGGVQLKGLEIKTKIAQ
jgi:hypothetical protein